MFPARVATAWPPGGAPPLPWYMSPRGWQQRGEVAQWAYRPTEVAEATPARVRT